MLTLLSFLCIGAVQWQHPAGMITTETIVEAREKRSAQEWAENVFNAKRRELEPWLKVSPQLLRKVFPRTCGNVYHNFSCPEDRSRLKFDPFQCDLFQCNVCGKTFHHGTDAGIYAKEDRYHGTMYDGWACLFYLTAAGVAADLGTIAQVEADTAAAKRGVELLLLFADTISGLPTQFAEVRQFNRVLTYHREGDNKILNDLACAYELLRDRMSEEQRRRVEDVVLRRMLEDLMLEPIYTYDHNNVYQWHRTILQTALALEREDLIDWSFGYGAFSPESQSEHRSLRRTLAKHFNPDGAFWELCSGYHLYPLHHLCEVAVLSRNLTRMDPTRFPAERYDLTDRRNPDGWVIRNALEWFVSLAMPDRTMPTIGDSMAPRAGMTDYFTTAEIGYRHYDVRAVGDYETLRAGKRAWAALLYGAPEIVQRYTPFTSSNLSSGWVSLRNEWNGNQVWVGLNALIKGGGHQHADRLSLVLYSQGKLLALEKATPYNEETTRELGTLSASHNTVTVDFASQKQGEALNEAETPRVAYFFACPFVKFAEVHADHLYPQTSAYRRSVALIEDIVIDFFRVEGGMTHDWMVHHAGPAPALSSELEVAPFSPPEWLTNGSVRTFAVQAESPWEAKWTVDGVTSRLSMAGASGTQVFGLETYPIDNAVVTPKNPPCQTLCVRRKDDMPYLAVWDAWTNTTNLTDITWCADGQALRLRTQSQTYLLCFGPGQVAFPGEVEIQTDGAFTLLRDDSAFLLVGGSKLEITTLKGKLSAILDQRATLAAKFANGQLTIETSGDIQYDTYGGRDHYRDAPTAKVTIRGNLWRIGGSKTRFAGHVF
ncbi:MAG: heparinase II/III family protein [Candidatus Hydrogenedentes bacterium]|nr:heparinase II/III family protein [Candidatus Hydrogenedentota bacterium]